MVKKKTNLVVSGVTNLVEDKRLDEIKDILIKLEKQNTLTNKKLTAIDKKLKSIDGKDLNLDDIWEYQISGVTVGEIIQNTSKKLNDVNDTLEVASEKIRYILGLVQHNFRFMEQTYNSKGNLSTGKIKIYNTSLECEKDLNPIAVYDITAIYDNQDHLIDYKVKAGI